MPVAVVAERRPQPWRSLLPRWASMMLPRWASMMRGWSPLRPVRACSSRRQPRAAPPAGVSAVVPRCWRCRLPAAPPTALAEAPAFEWRTRRAAPRTASVLRAGLATRVMFATRRLATLPTEAACSLAAPATATRTSTAASAARGRPSRGGRCEAASTRASRRSGRG